MKEELQDTKVITGTTLLLKILMRMETQLQEVGNLGTQFVNDLELNYKTMIESVCQLSGSNEHRERLELAINDLITQQTKFKRPLPELTKKKIAKIKQAVIKAVGGHFGRWEQLIQTESLQVMGKVNVLENQTIIPETIMNAIKGIKRGEDKK